MACEDSRLIFQLLLPSSSESMSTAVSPLVIDGEQFWKAFHGIKFYLDIHDDPKDKHDLEEKIKLAGGLIASSANAHVHVVPDDAKNTFSGGRVATVSHVKRWMAADRASGSKPLVVRVLVNLPLQKRENIGVPPMGDARSQSRNVVTNAEELAIVPMYEKPLPKIRRESVRWSDEESNKLIKAYQALGSQWKKIHIRYFQKSRRTQCDLKDKYRTLVKSGLVKK